MSDSIKLELPVDVAVNIEFDLTDLLWQITGPQRRSDERPYVI